MLNRLTLRQQLIGLCCIFLLPLLLLMALLVNQAQTDIAFSSKERLGVAYLKQLWPALTEALESEKPDNLNPLRQAGARLDATMQSWAASSQLLITLEMDKPATEQLAAGLALITAIGDGSNLILDPDLDSYYLMDLVIQRLPVVSLQMEEVRALLTTYAAGDTVDFARQLAIHKGQIAASHQAIRSAMDAAVRNNAGGTLSKQLMTPYSRTVVSLELYQRQLRQLALVTDDPAQAQALIKAINSQQGQLSATVSALYMATLGSLDQLLANRIESKTRKLILSLSLAGAAIVCAFLFAVMLGRRISSRVQILSQRIQTLTEGDMHTPIPFQDSDNEIGTIARSLTVFRQHAEEKAVLASQIEEERAQTQRRLETLAYCDDLTGLPNRKHLLDTIEQHSCAPAGEGIRLPAALICFDLDGFKEVNDTATHQAGDEILRQVGERISRLTRDRDVVARLGGDEFAMFVHVADDQVLLQQLCERILQHLSEPYRVRGTLQYLTASAGVAVIPTTSSHDGRELMRRADVAMYRAKASGKNRVVFFDSSFDSEILYRKALESSLREGLTKGEVTLAFQPQFDAASGRLVGVEGLARWTSERHGEVAPALFIPIAESSGLILELGRQVLAQAVLACRRWPSLQVSVNVSVVQLRQPDFINQIANAMIDLSAPSNRIELEITESVVMEDDRMLAAKLAALRDLGFKLALDDFGTGYSSLSYLARHRFDRLKIDRSFIRNIASNAHGEALLRSIASLGRSLQMEVCAEGVETFADVEAASKAGCTHLQGFYFSAAVPISEIDKLISNGLSEAADPRLQAAIGAEAAAVTVARAG